MILNSIIKYKALNILVQILELDTQNKSVKKQSNQAKKIAAVIFDFSEFLL